MAVNRKNMRLCTFQVRGHGMQLSVTCSTNIYYMQDTLESINRNKTQFLCPGSSNIVSEIEVNN